MQIKCWFFFSQTPLYFIIIIINSLKIIPVCIANIIFFFYVYHDEIQNEKHWLKQTIFQHISRNPQIVAAPPTPLSFLRANYMPASSLGV